MKSECDLSDSKLELLDELEEDIDCAFGLLQQSLMDGKEGDALEQYHLIEKMYKKRRLLLT